MEKYQNELLKDTLELLSFDGEEGKPLPGAPFGEGNRQCLDWFLSKAESFGFNTKNLDGYCGVADIGEGESFGILGHLDTRCPWDDGCRITLTAEFRATSFTAEASLTTAVPCLRVCTP